MVFSILKSRTDMREICICDVYSMYKKMMEIKLMRNVSIMVNNREEKIRVPNMLRSYLKVFMWFQHIFSHYQLLYKGNFSPFKQTPKQKMVTNLQAQVLVPMASFAVPGLECKQSQRKGKRTSPECQVGREWTSQEWERKMHCALFTESRVKWVWPSQAIEFYFYSVCFF